MTETQLRQIAAAGESEAMEFKASTGQRQEGAQAICAMLNHRGGRVIFGITPDHRVKGQQVTDKTLEDVSQALKQIEPPVFPALGRVRLGDGAEAIVVTVEAGQQKPYSVNGRAYKRVGNTTQQMDREEYNRMLLERMHAQTRWENEIASGWELADLDAGEITRTIDEAIRRGRAEEPGTRSPGDLLRGLGLLKNRSLTRAAVVLFAKPDRLQAEYPQLLLRVARFKGTDKTEFLDNRRFFGNAFELMRRGEQFVNQNVPIAGRIIPGVFEREDSPLYPPAAVREALANAICHRDYSIGGGGVDIAIYEDRMEITSAGILHFGLTPAALMKPHASMPWNPLIANVFHKRGIIESWGRGTIKIMELMNTAGLPRPRLLETAGSVTVLLQPHVRAVQKIPTRVSARQTRVLEILGTRPMSSLKEILELFGPGASREAVKADLQDLRRMGLVQSFGVGRGSSWAKTRRD